MLHYRASAGEARLLQAELNHARKHSVALIQADLLDVGKLPSLVEQTVQTFGRLDGARQQRVVVLPTPVGEITAGAIGATSIGTNLQAPLFLSRRPRPRCARRRARSSTSPTSTPSGRSRTTSSIRSPRRASWASRARLRASWRRRCASTRSRPGRSCGRTTSRSTSCRASGSSRTRRCGAKARPTTSRAPCISCSPRRTTSPARRSTSTAAATSRI